MKRVVLLAVMLAAYSACLFAGEYLMNDTGQMVYGLHVVFSEPVTITGYGDVLMAVDPAGKSTTFTFSGSRLESWGGHWLNWEPASARLVAWEWLAGVADAGVEQHLLEPAEYAGSDYNSFFSWSRSDLVGVDPADTSTRSWNYAAPNDLIAAYLRRLPTGLQVRIDFLDLPPTLWAAVSLRILLRSASPSPVAEILLASPTECSLTVNGTRSISAIHDVVSDSSLDSVAFCVSTEALVEVGFEIGERLTITAEASSPDGRSQTDVLGPCEASGAVKAVPFVYQIAAWGPGGPGATWGDVLGGDGSSSGYLRILEAAERWQQPLVLVVDEELLICADQFGHLDYLRELQDAGLLEISGSAPVGFGLPWQDSFAGAKSIAWMSQYLSELGLSSGPSFAPYEAIISRESFDTISAAGFPLITSCVTQFENWFGKPPYEDLYRLHEVNSRLVAFFQSCLDCNEITDQTPEDMLTPGHKKTLISHLAELSRQPDSFVFWYDDGFGFSGLWPETFAGGPEYFESFVRWVAAHPWIEMLTFGDLLRRGLSAVDQGEVFPIRDFHPIQGDRHYLAYYPQYYYGGISDGHSPNIQRGERIEGYSEYIPILADGLPILSGLQMGDAWTPDTIVHNVMTALVDAPEGSLTELAWYAYFVCLCAQNERVYPDGRIGGPLLPDRVKRGATWLRKIGAVLRAAEWSQFVAEDDYPADTTVTSCDLDWDGEEELVMANNRVYAVFEDDGGRLELLVAYDEELREAIPVIYPAWLLHGNRQEGEASRLGEAALFGFRLPPPDAAFVEEGMHAQRYTAEVGVDYVRMTSPDGVVSKTFKLPDGSGTLDAAYEATRPTNVSLGFCVNPMALFQEGTSSHWQMAEGVNEVCIECALGGSVHVSTDGLTNIVKHSFLPPSGWYRPYVTLQGWGIGSFSLTVDTTGSYDCSAEPNGSEDRQSSAASHTRVTYEIVPQQPSTGCLLVDDFEDALTDTFMGWDIDYDCQEFHISGSDPDSACEITIAEAPENRWLRLDYTNNSWLAVRYWGFPAFDASAYAGLEMTLWAAEQSAIDVSIGLISEATGWIGARVEKIPIGTEPVTFRLPFAAFAIEGGSSNTSLGGELRNLINIAIHVPRGVGTINVDDIRFYVSRD